MASASSIPTLTGPPAAPTKTRAATHRLLTPAFGAERLKTWAQLAPALVLFALFVLLPLGFFVVYSFWQVVDYQIVAQWTFGNYTSAFGNSAFRALLLNTVEIAGITAVVTTVIATALAAAARFPLARWQSQIMFCLLIALFSGYLVRIFAWETLLGTTGIINTALQDIGLIGQPINALIYTKFTAIVVLTNFLIPMAFVPCNAAFQNLRDSEVDAARDLGAGALRTYRRVILPLAWPGIFSSFALTFIVASGDFLTPSLVGGRSGTMVGQQIADTFLNQFNWPAGASMAAIDLISVLAVVGVAGYLGRRVLR